MPWEIEKVEEKRMQLVKSYLEGVPMTYLCKLHQVSRKTGYKWVCRHEEEQGLKDRSRAPHNPARKYDDILIDRALDLKLRKRHWGPKKILVKLKKDYPEEEWPSATWLYHLYKDNHLTIPRKLRRRVPATHPLGDVNECNDVWMADFKGWFLTQNKQKCEPLTITDGHTRYLIRCDHLAKKSTEYVWPIFAEAFREYGLPKRIRTDNGPPFGTLGAGRLGPLAIKLIKAGVVPEWINPGHPEENGRHERFHLTLKQAIASPPAKNLKAQIDRMKEFQEEYNNERPHEALELNSPSSLYRASGRAWDGVLRSPEYETKTTVVRKVCQSGCIWLKQKEYYIGQALVGENIGLKEKEDEVIEVFYGPIFLGILRDGGKLEKPKMVVKKIIRRG